MQNFHRSPHRILHLCPERIPRFGHQSKADRSLAEALVLLNKQFLKGPRRVSETSTEALIRIGFVRRSQDG